MRHISVLVGSFPIDLDATSSWDLPWLFAARPSPVTTPPARSNSLEPEGLFLTLDPQSLIAHRLPGGSASKVPNRGTMSFKGPRPPLMLAAV